MAQHVITTYTDDLDGSQASGNVKFSLDGRQYEIDLSDANAEKLRDILVPFVAAARRAGGGRGRQASSSSRRDPGPGRSQAEMAEMRTWLREHGYKVSDRGRIPNEYVQAWETKTVASHADGKGKNGLSVTVPAVQFQPA
jgi:nucleoid-associated protein Lsr2